MRRLALIAVTLLVASLGARAQTIQEFLKASTVRWNTPTEPFRIIGNINYVGTNGLAVYLITSPQGHVLISPRQRRKSKAALQSSASRSPTSNICSTPTPTSTTPVDLLS